MPICPCLLPCSGTEQENLSDRPRFRSCSSTCLLTLPQPHHPHLKKGVNDSSWIKVREPDICPRQLYQHYFSVATCPQLSKHCLPDTTFSQSPESWREKRASRSDQECLQGQSCPPAILDLLSYPLLLVKMLQSSPHPPPPSSAQPSTFHCFFILPSRGPKMLCVHPGELCPSPCGGLTLHPGTYPKLSSPSQIAKCCLLGFTS